MLKKISLILSAVTVISLSSIAPAVSKDSINRGSFPDFKEEVETYNQEGGLDKDFLSSNEAFRNNVWIEGNTLYLGFDIEEDYYLYRDKIDIVSRDDNVVLKNIKLPKGNEVNDEFFGDVYVYEGYNFILADIENETDDISSFPISITFQGCAKAGLCYPPDNLDIDVNRFSPPYYMTDAFNEFLDSGDLLLKSDINEKDNTTSSEEETFEKGYLAIILTFFLIGIGLSFTPCVLPMLPILSSIIVGKNRNKKEAFKIASSYSLGVIIVYTLFGLFVGMLGSGLNIQAHLQSPYVVIPMALVFIAFSLLMFGKVSLSNIVKTNGKVGAKISDAQDKASKSGTLGSMIAGMLSVLILSPCVSAPLAGVLVYISTTGDTLVGALSLASMALGMSVLLIVAGTFGASKIPKSGMWMEHIKNIFGFMLLGMSVWVTGYLLNDNIYYILLSTIGFFIGFELVKLSLLKEGTIVSFLIKLLTFGVLSISLTYSGVSIKSMIMPEKIYSIERKNENIFKKENNLSNLSKRVEKGNHIVYFSADWCVSCRKIDRDIFNNSEYIETLSQNNIELTKIDVTKNTDNKKEILDEFNIFGPPAFLVFKDGMLESVQQGEIDIEKAYDIVNIF